MKPPKFPVYDGKGNAFDWILREADALRQVRQKENQDVAKATKESQRLDRAKVADAEREAIDPRRKSDRRKVPSRSGNSLTIPARVRSDNQGKTGRQGGG